MTKTRLNLRKMLLMFVLIPLITTAVGLTILSARIMVHDLEANTIEELKVAAYALREYYEYDIVNDNDLVNGFCEYDTEYIDRMKETGVDFTLFKDNIRFMTTIRDNNGARIEGTPASDAVWAAVSKGEDYSSDDVVINGIDYYVYYTPLTDGQKVYGMAFSGKDAGDVKAAEKRIYIQIAVVCAGLVVIFTVIALYFVKKVATPIKDIAEGLEKLSSGDTDASFETTSHIDETVKLIKASNRLKNALKGAVGDIRSSTDELIASVDQTASLSSESSSATEQIADSMSGLSQTTQTLAESVQDINGEIVEMGRMVEEASSHTEALHGNAKAMSTANSEAIDCIGSVAGSSEKSSKAVEDIITKIASTNEAVAKIHEMVNLITEIASQTNLLALNASIEAARAGDAGKGFAVVAEEIGKLATQSNDSANQIKDVVGEISRLSDECVASSEQVKDIIDEERGLLSTAQEKFSVLGQNIESSVEEIAGIVAVVEKLDGVKDTVTNSISDLSAISEETSATNEEVTASVESVTGNVKDVAGNAEAMSKLAEKLKEAVAYFK